MMQSKNHSKNICGEALAPFVKDIICLNLTEEMLAQGKKLAGESGISDIEKQNSHPTRCHHAKSASCTAKQRFFSG